VSGPRPSLALTALAVAVGAAEFGPWFGEGMVLQRDRPIVVRGTARAGAAVLVRLGDVGIGVDADADGRWTARFPARPASTRPLELEAKDGIADVRLGDILVGDVWLAAGQSNMEFPPAPRGAPRRRNCRRRPRRWCGSATMPSPGNTTGRRGSTPRRSRG
jgi:sialate O-acetylesterase